MKILLCLFFFLICVVPVSTYAEDAPVRGIIGGDEKKLPPITDEDLQESLDVSDACKAYGMSRTYYDCDCMGMKFLEMRRKVGKSLSAFDIREKVKRECPNGPEMAGMIYNQCLGWAPMERGEDYEPFCSCYGSEYAKNYSKNPSDNQYVREAQMTQALITCDSNSVNRKKQDMQALVKKLKEEGTYEKLFPGAALSQDVTNNPTIPLPK